MTNTGSSSGELDSGLMSLVDLAKFHNVAADPKQLQHHFGSHDCFLDENALVRAARHIKLRAKSVKLTCDQLEKVALPAIAISHDGTYFILAQLQFSEGIDDSGKVYSFFRPGRYVDRSAV